MDINGTKWLHMVFFGEYIVSMATPGRLVLPKKIRELIKGNTFIVTKGFQFCLSGYDKEAWEERAEELLSVSLIEEENLEKRRFIFSSASLVEIDEQGRFVIPKNLAQYASLQGKVVIIGVGDHFEIWKEEQWVNYLEKGKN